MTKVDRPPHALLCRKFRQMHDREPNALLVWMALLYRFGQTPPKTEVQGPDDEIAIPRWCAEYLSTSAHNIITLFQGNDFREGTSKNAVLLPKEAAELAPAALGLTRSGWNAFATASGSFEKMKDVVELARLRQSGLSARAALEKLMEKRGIENEPSMRKRLAQGRMLRGEQSSKPRR